MGDITQQYGSFYRTIWLELKCTVAEMEKQGHTVRGLFKRKRFQKAVRSIEEATI